MKTQLHYLLQELKKVPPYTVITAALLSAMISEAIQEEEYVSDFDPDGF